MKQDQFRNRVVERRRIKGKELHKNPLNWRRHPLAQKAAIGEVLREVGQVGELYAYYSERNGGKLTLVDGELRAGDFGEQEWDVAILDVTDAEADRVLLTRDPLAAMAETSREALAKLTAVAQGREGSGGPVSLPSAAEAAAPSGEVVPLLVDVKPLQWTWALVGLPTSRWGEVAEAVERLASVEGIFCEVTPSERGP